MTKFFDTAEQEFRIRELMDLGYTLEQALDMVADDEATAESEYQEWLDQNDEEYEDQIVDDWRSEAEYDY
jgi:hypothetical protein